MSGLSCSSKVVFKKVLRAFNFLSVRPCIFSESRFIGICFVVRSCVCCFRPCCLGSFVGFLMCLFFCVQFLSRCWGASLFCRVCSLGRRIRACCATPCFFPGTAVIGTAQLHSTVYFYGPRTPRISGAHTRFEVRGPGAGARGCDGRRGLFPYVFLCSVYVVSVLRGVVLCFTGDLWLHYLCFISYAALIFVFACLIRVYV